MSPDATGRHSVRFPHCISFCYFQATKGGLLNTGVSFKGAVGCGKDHPRPRVSPNVALAAPCQAKWDGIFPFVSGGGSQETAWGSVCKLSRVTTGVLLHRCLRHLGRQVRAPSSTNQRQGAGRGLQLPPPRRGPPGCSRLPRPRVLRLRGRQAASSPSAGRAECDSGAPRVDLRPAGRLPTRGPAGPRSQQPGALPRSVTDPGRWSSCQNRGCLFHSGSQSPKGEQGALMLVFGHKQLSLIILFLLSLPVPPASSPRNGPRNPPRSADRSGFCAARSSGAFMSLRV